MELTNDFRVALPVERAWAVLTDLELIAPCMPGAQLQEIEGDEHRGVVKIKVGPITAQYKGQAVFLERDAVNHVAVLRAEGRETRGQGNANATITASLVADGDGTAVSIVTDLTVTGRVAQFGRGVLADVSAKLLDQFVVSLERTVLAEEAGAPMAPSEAARDEATAVAPDAGGEVEVSPAAKDAPPTAATAKAQSATAATAKAPSAKAESAKAPSTKAASAKAAPAKRLPAAKSAPSESDTEPSVEVAGAPPVEVSDVVAGAPTAPVAPAAEVARPAVRRVDSPEPEPVNLLDAAGSPVAKRVGPILAAVAVLWLLKKLLSRRRR